MINSQISFWWSGQKLDLVEVVGREPAEEVRGPRRLRQQRQIRRKQNCFRRWKRMPQSLGRCKNLGIYSPSVQLNLTILRCFGQLRFVREAVTHLLYWTYRLWVKLPVTTTVVFMTSVSSQMVPLASKWLIREMQITLKKLIPREGNIRRKVMGSNPRDIFSEKKISIIFLWNLYIQHVRDVA